MKKNLRKLIYTSLAFAMASSVYAPHANAVTKDNKKYNACVSSCRNGALNKSGKAGSKNVNQINIGCAKQCSGTKGTYDSTLM